MTEVETRNVFTPNLSLDEVLADALRESGMGFFRRWLFGLRVRRASAEDRDEIERKVTELLLATRTTGGVPVSDGTVNGIYVENWQDLFEWFLANLPAILEAIMSILALF